MLLLQFPVEVLKYQPLSGQEARNQGLEAAAMGDNTGGGTRGRKRKRQVSWAAAELLEEVRWTHALVLKFSAWM